MKILFTGGGTGGHFYGIIAVAERINLLVEKEKIIKRELFFMSNSPYDKVALYETDIQFVYVPAGKIRPNFSIKNIIDSFKIFFGAVIAVFKLFYIYPDVVFIKGGYGSFPTLFAACILRIPIVVHESDSIPGKVNLLAGKFATRIGVAYDEAGQYFKKEKTAWVGQPVRSAFQKVSKENAFEYLNLDLNIPVIFVLGGSNGAKKINDVLMEALPELLVKYQIIHQGGKDMVEEIKTLTSVILKDNPYKSRYKLFPFLNVLAMKMSAGASSLVISRAGSTLFEIANWGIPSLIIPLQGSHADHQKKNAYNYARAGACDVLEEGNLTPHLLVSEINRLIDDKERMQKMAESAKIFAKPDAAKKIAQVLVDIGLSHEK